MYSQTEYNKRGIGLFKDGFNIEYFRNSFIHDSDNTRSYYTLKFKYTFRYDNDVLYIAYSVPYTYT